MLADRTFLADDFSIADIANAAVLRAARERVPYSADAHPAIEAWYARMTARPAWTAAIETRWRQPLVRAGTVPHGRLLKRWPRTADVCPWRASSRRDR